MTARRKENLAIATNAKVDTTIRVTGKTLNIHIRSILDHMTQQKAVPRHLKSAPGRYFQT